MAAGLEFGLSLDPYSVPQRHCFYDSDDEEDEGEGDGLDCTFVSMSPNVSDPIKLLIVCTSEITGAFIKTHVMLDHPPLSILNCNTKPSKALKRCLFQSEDSDKDTIPYKLGEMYSVTSHSNTLVYFCLDYLKEDYCNEWSRKIIDYCRPQRVVILHSLLSHEYYFTSEEDDLKHNSRQFLRSLQTQWWSDQSLAPYLNPYNKLTSEPAAVLTECQVSSVSASLVNLYTFSSLTKEEQVVGLCPLLTNSIIKKCISINPSKVINEKMSSMFPYKPRTDLDLLYT
jgi:hypothetical protein